MFAFENDGDTADKSHRDQHQRRDQSLGRAAIGMGIDYMLNVCADVLI